MCNGLKNFPIFVKTHLSNNVYKIALSKEYQIMQSVYGKEMFLECLSIPTENNAESIFLLMDYLKPGCSMSKKDIAEVIEQYSNNDTLQFNGKDMYDIEELLTEAKKSLCDLDEKGFYSANIVKMAEILLSELESYLASSTRILCHGDLADKNIMMTSDNKKILLDWEDAFWGVDGYDYLYWLTFFSHRRFYNNSEVFKLPSVLPEIVAGILTLIVLIKNAISYYSGEYVNNTLSMDNRLKEIYVCMGIRI